MSANNFILISYATNKKKTIVVTERDFDTNGVLSLIWEGQNLKTAIKKAKEYMDGNEVEYGIDFDLK